MEFEKSEYSKCEKGDWSRRRWRDLDKKIIESIYPLM